MCSGWLNAHTRSHAIGTHTLPFYQLIQLHTRIYLIFIAFAPFCMLLVVRAETCGLAGDRILIRKIINSSLNDVCLSRFFPPSSTDESHGDVVAVCLNRHHAQCLRNLCVSSPQWKIVAPSSQFINVKPLQLPASLPHTHTHAMSPVECYRCSPSSSSRVHILPQMVQQGILIDRLLFCTCSTLSPGTY